MNYLTIRLKEQKNCRESAYLITISFAIVKLST